MTGYSAIALTVFATAIAECRLLADEPIPSRGLFSVACQLRTNAIPASVSFAPGTEFSLASARSVPLEVSIQSYECMNGTPLLSVPVPQTEPAGAAGFLKTTILDPITHLETVKVGKVHLTGGVVGAIKNKNPFHLLNPLIFAVDW